MFTAKSHVHSMIMSGRVGAEVPQSSAHRYIYSFSKEWRPDPYSIRRISTGCFSSWEEVDAAAAESLFLMGYKTPRWWQWWRWGEPNPPKEVLQILATKEPSNA
ncbi:hypothetical protein [Rhizobium leguminosarum]|uniref:hypothetical protein n=1 Tax=Rhizobium leguminosarum TaxID=384 RepID=UPI001C945672|nr:hypothetical protein [Rhizobium leguminosarum]MBY5821504.1 hypothetical protein [Rhizobium leguminosarum]